MIVLEIIFALLESILAFFWTSIDQISTLSLARFFRIFWFLIIFDIPRYIITDIVLLVLVIRGRLAKEFTFKKRPLISIIVPAHNEAGTIEQTIRSLLETNYPNKEIIVVDDGSTDNTYHICKTFADQGLIKLFRKELRGGKASALTLGLKASHGEFIVAVDSDSTFDRDALYHLIKHFGNPAIGAVCGNIKVRNRRKNLLTRLQAAEYLITISVGRIFLSTANFLTIVSGAFGAFRREVLERTGAWDPGIGDDSNVTLKSRKLGARIAFAKDAIALTNVPETLRGLYRQRKRWNKSFIRNRFKKHRDILNVTRFGFSSAIAILLNFFYRVVLLFMFLFWTIQIIISYRQLLPMIIILTLLIYTTLNLLSLTISSLLSERKEDWWNLLLAPLMPIYRLFLRLPRTIAFLEEFFYLRYTDPFYPKKVWLQTPKWK